MDIRPISNVVQQANVAGERQTVLPDASAIGELEASTAAMAVATAGVIKQPDPASQAEQVTQAIKSINKAMEGYSQSLEFSIDEHSKRTIVKVVDQNTKVVIRQIPTLEVLEIAKALDQARGLLISQMA